MNKGEKQYKKPWGSPHAMNIHAARERILSLPSGSDCGLSREEALELIKRIDRYCQLFLRQYGACQFLLESISRARHLPAKQEPGKWPFCPGDTECHIFGCQLCWIASSRRAGEILARDTREGMAADGMDWPVFTENL